jgi:hypothetical protein
LTRELRLNEPPALKTTRRQLSGHHGRLDGATLITVVRAVSEAASLGDLRDVGEGLIDSLLSAH